MEEKFGHDDIRLEKITDDKIEEYLNCKKHASIFSNGYEKFDALWEYMKAVILESVYDENKRMLVYNQLDDNDAAIWSLLLASGYLKVVEYGGGGALVPITGFANSVTAPCIEYKKEGQVYGIGCKIFTIAGPVILYGIVTSFLLGILYLICKMM